MAIFLADRFDSLYLFVSLIGFFFLIMIVDTGPFDSRVDNIVHVCNNALYTFVIIIMAFLKAKPYFSPYEEGEKERIALRVMITYTGITLGMALFQFIVMIFKLVVFV